jgi:hypothetical protein
MATTTNFGWETPDDTDLVKDGAAAMRTLGNSIDTSFVDLKGGTTGQILSKASNTDLDYTWVTTDDANAIQNAIVDAKGDLIAATAADTPARLAVGSDYAFLQALSSETTGLRWNNATWTSYTPVVTPTSGTGYTMTGSGYYTRIGKLCVMNFIANITTNGTGAGKIQMSLPINARYASAFASGSFRENNLTGKIGSPFINSATSFLMSSYDDSYPAATGAALAGFLVYEVA